MLWQRDRFCLSDIISTKASIIGKQETGTIYAEFCQAAQVYQVPPAQQKDC